MFLFGEGGNKPCIRQTVPLNWGSQSLAKLLQGSASTFTDMHYVQESNITEEPEPCYHVLTGTV